MTTERHPCPKGAPDHHWVIEPSNGAVSKDVCQYCGDTRDFSNSGEPTSHFRLAGKVELAKKKRGDEGDFLPGGFRVLPPRWD